MNPINSINLHIQRPPFRTLSSCENWQSGRPALNCFFPHWPGAAPHLPKCLQKYYILNFIVEAQAVLRNNTKWQKPSPFVHKLKYRLIEIATLKYS